MRSPSSAATDSDDSAARHAYGCRLRDRGRPTPTDLYLLPPGAGARRAGRADAAHAGRPAHARDRARLPAARSNARAAAGARQEARSATRASPMSCRRSEQLPERLDAVLHVVYLVFNEGYSATSGATIVRRELTCGGDPAGARAGPAHARRARGARLAGPAAAPGFAPRRAPERERRARPARGSGPLALGRGRIEEGLAALDRAARLGAPGRYQLQAAIAAVHAEAVAADATDWARIVLLYDRLMSVAALTGRGAQPGRGRLDGQSGRPRRWRSSTDSPRVAIWTTTTCFIRRAASCCGAWAGAPRRPTSTARPRPLPRTPRSASSWSGAARSWSTSAATRAADRLSLSGGG